MKKLLTLVLALAMTLSLAACGGGGEDTADEGSEGSTSGETTKMTLLRRDASGIFSSVFLDQGFVFIA